MIRFNPKINDEVRVCYDGKISRCVCGLVIDVGYNKIKVRFSEWAGDKDIKIEWWFKRINEYKFGGFVKVKDSLMKMMFGCEGDWYSVYQIIDK